MHDKARDDDGEGITNNVCGRKGAVLQQVTPGLPCVQWQGNGGARQWRCRARLQLLDS
jgi:hypothetical protein